MTVDRWNPRKIVTDAPKGPEKVFVPGDVSSAPSTVTEHPAGFRVRSRGDTSGTVTHTYRCPVHGVFDAFVPREDVPDDVICGSHTAIFCGHKAPWAGSSCGIGISSGMVKS